MISLRRDGHPVCHDDQAGRIGMKRLLDNLIGHMGAAIVAGVDMMDNSRDRLSQNSYRSINV
jgi:hypothetical protein